MPEDFQDEHNDGRRQHKYTTKDQKPERPWKRWCMQLLCCLIIVAIMILISIYMQKLFDPPEDEDWSDDAVNATDDDLVGVAGEVSGTSSLLPKPMAYVEDVCSEDRLHIDDTSTCETACAPALDCCDPFANGNSTCFEEQSAGCFTYAKCHSLDGFFDPAHNDLDRICSKASLEISREECVLACSSVECCYLEEVSCVSANFQTCLDYAACQNLKEDSIDVAPMDLDERCGKQTPTCKRDCKEALCCSDPNSACYRDNFVTCLSYSACTGHSDVKITVAPIHSRVKRAPPLLVDACSIKGFAEFGGPTKCLEACAAAQCCWEDGAGGCFGDDPLGCMEYQRCTILKRPEYVGLTFPPGAASTPSEPAAAAAAAAAANAPNNDNNSTNSAPAVAPVGNETEAGATNR